MYRTILCAAAAALFIGNHAVGQAPAQTGQVTPAADITNAEVQAALAKTASIPLSDEQLRMVSINGEYNVGAALVHRAKTAGREADPAFAHNEVTEVYYIISGNGVLVTGGIIENAKDAGPKSRRLLALVARDQKS